MDDERFISEQERVLIEKLYRCRFAPGGYDKRFVRDMHAKQGKGSLTEKQRGYLSRLAVRYRKQLQELRDFKDCR